MTLVSRTLQFFALTVSLVFSSLVSAQSSSQAGEHRISYPQDNQIYIRPEQGRQEVGFISGDKRYKLFSADRILSVPVFSGQADSGVTSWKQIQVKKSDSPIGLLESPTSWFYAMTESGLQFVQRVALESSPFVSFLIPLKSVSLQKLSTSMLRMNNGDQLIFISYLNNDGARGTFIVKTISNEDIGKFGQYEVMNLDSEYHDFDKIKSEQKVFFKLQGESLLFNEKNYSLSALSANKKYQVGKAQFVEQFQSNRPKLGFGSLDGLAKEAKGFISTFADQTQKLAEATIEGAKARETTGASPSEGPSALPKEFIEAGRKTAAAAQPQVQVNSAKTGGAASPSTRREIEHMGEKFVLYNASTKQGEGVYIQRLSDKTIVHIATKSVNLGQEGSLEGFSIAEGILSHPELARKIDLESKFFTMEATFRPRAASTEVAWADQEFPNFRSSDTVTMSTIPAREELVKNIHKQILKPSRASSILVGEAGDKNLVIREVIHQLPRTWRALDLDPGVLGSDIGIVGEFEKKVRKLTDIQKTVPVIWVSENFENLKGLGAAGDSKRDFLDLIKKEMSEGGSFKVLGTSFSSTDLLGRVKDQALLQNLQIKDVENLSSTQVVEYLQYWMKNHPDLPQVSDEFLKYVYDVANDFRPIDPEPQRSLDLLEMHLLKMVDAQNMFAADNKAEFNKSASEFYRMNPDLRDRKKQKMKLDSLMSFLKSKIIGHEQIMQETYDATKIALAGLTNGKGPRASFLLDGPPGTGKTEFAMTYAEAIGLPFIRIEMNQFKPGTGNGINELMSQVSKALKINPYTVILFDEVEKSDYAVLEGLLAMMDNATFSFYENHGDGQKRAVRSSARNATVFFTANTVGDAVREVFFNIPREEREQMDGKQLLKKLYEINSKEAFEELQVQKIPRPLFDRIRLRSILFPPNSKGFEAILKIKMSSFKKMAEANLKSKVDIANADPYIHQQIETALSENWSTRDLINAVDKTIAALTADIAFLENYEEKGHYQVDITNQHVSRIDNSSGSDGSSGGSTPRGGGSYLRVRCEAVYRK